MSKPENQTNAKSNPVDFSARLNGYDPEAPELLKMVDAVTLAADRAEGILHSLYWAHEEKGDVPERDQVRNAVDAAILELKDIRAVMTHYLAATHQQSEPVE